MKSIPRHNGEYGPTNIPPGRYGVSVDGFGIGTVMLRCPCCEQAFVLHRCNTLLRTRSEASHGIGPDGTVSPSVVCPTKGCTYHEFVRLEDWKPLYQ